MKVMVNVEKRHAFVIMGLLVLGIGIFVVNALTAGETPNPGHNIQSVGPPSGCVSGQVLRFIDGSWDCVSAAAVPSGLCMFKFSGSCPSGWSRNSALDGRTIRGAKIPGKGGGSESHSHTSATHKHLTSTAYGASRSYHKTSPPGGTASQNAVCDHTPAVTPLSRTLNWAYTDLTTPGPTGSTSSWPPYMNVIICCKD